MPTLSYLDSSGAKHGGMANSEPNLLQQRSWWIGNFRVPDLITYISSITPLQPGDIISTGTPSGVGLGRTPHRWLRPGETIITEIQGDRTVNQPGDHRGVTTLRSGLLTSQLYLRRGSPVS